MVLGGALEGKHGLDASNDISNWSTPLFPIFRLSSLSFPAKFEGKVCNVANGNIEMRGVELVITALLALLQARLRRTADIWIMNEQSGGIR